MHSSIVHASPTLRYHSESSLSIAACLSSNREWNWVGRLLVDAEVKRLSVSRSGGGRG